MARTAYTVNRKGYYRLKPRTYFSPMKKSHVFGPWSNLSGDLFQTIMARLELEERVCASIVCKNWYSEYKRMNAETLENMAVWNFNHRWEKSDASGNATLRTKLYDPHFNSLYHLEWTSKTDAFFGARPCAQRHSCFLFAKKWRFKTYFFLYHAYSKRHISLPCLQSYYDIATFTKDPFSPGCIVFASYHTNSKVYAATCNIGDFDWKTTVVDAKHPLTSVVYDKQRNAFYSVFSKGLLARFRVSDREWKVVSRHDFDFEDDAKEIRQYLVQNAGDLYLIAKSTFHVNTFRFEWSSKRWIILNPTTEDVDSLFIKNSGDGIFFNINSNYYAQKNQKICWIDPPSVTNYYYNVSEQLKLMDHLSTATNYY